MEENNRNMMNECYQCKHKRNIHGDRHISCLKPDPDITGIEHGIKNGWFFYPINFDPIWKTKDCSNFEVI
jgi:hypothetical protein